MEHNEWIANIRLALTTGIGPFSYLSLLRKYGSACQAVSEIKKHHTRFTNKLASLQTVEKEIAAVKKFGGQIITYTQKEYPQLLRNIDHPPMYLCVKGNIELLSKDIFAIVGTRNASANARFITSKLAKSIGEENYIIISGLARGIDTTAHESSILTGTIAVLAGGIANIFPPENKDLYHKIAEYGLIISEHPLSMIATAPLFPRRNRIISGLAQAVLIVEASIRSGSLITANYALEQGKEIFAVPGSMLDKRSQGTNKLIKDGAHLVQNIDDILIPLKNNKRIFERSNKVSMAEPIIDNQENLFSFTQNNFHSCDQSPVEDGFFNETINNNDDNDNDYKKDYENDYAKAKQELLNLVSIDPTDKNKLFQATRFENKLFNQLLVELVLEAKIKEESPGYFSLI